MSLLKELPKPIDDTIGWPWTEEVNPTAYDKNVNWPKISIVTPSFNQGHFIEETIRSILLQNYPNLEYIIIDGGSTDNTVEILKKYDPWITYWVSEPDNGQSDAINKGINKATGEVFNWLNSDDYYLPEALKKVSGYFLNNNIDIICGKEYLMLNNKFTLSKGSTICRTIDKTIFYFHIDQPPTFFRLNKIKEINGVSNDFHYLMDAELWIKYLLKNGQEKILKVDDAFNVFRLHETSKTVSLNAKFEIERAFLHYLILKKTFVAHDLLESIFDVPEIKRYLLVEHKIDWKVNLRDELLNKIVPLLLTPYTFKAYFAHKYDLCKAIFKLIGISTIIRNKSLLILYLKISFLPMKVLKVVRKRSYYFTGKFPLNLR